MSRRKQGRPSKRARDIEMFARLIGRKKSGYQNGTRRAIEEILKAVPYLKPDYFGGKRVDAISQAQRKLERELKIREQEFEGRKSQNRYNFWRELTLLEIERFSPVASEIERIEPLLTDMSVVCVREATERILWHAYEHRCVGLLIMYFLYCTCSRVFSIVMGSWLATSEVEPLPKERAPAQYYRMPR